MAEAVESDLQEENMTGGQGIVVVIPARYGSARFPGKVLARICGKCMIEHVWERAKGARNVDRVVIATDDERIEREAERFGAEVMMTAGEIPSGTDRVAVAAGRLEAQIIINVQGDEPLTESRTIDDLARYMKERETVEIGTVVRPVMNPRELTDPCVVKAVLSPAGRVLYFSRSVIPHHPDPNRITREELLEKTFYAHVGLYAYRRPALFRMAALPPSNLERRESLEQLRALENGIPIYAIIREVESIGVDHPSQIPLVERLLAKKTATEKGK